VVPKTCGELSWFEKISREFENDPEYLKEYISLCSSEIGCLQKKVAALEQRCKELEAGLSDANHDIDTASESVKILMEANDKLEAANSSIMEWLNQR